MLFCAWARVVMICAQALPRAGSRIVSGDLVGLEPWPHTVVVAVALTSTETGEPNPIETLWRL